MTSFSINEVVKMKQRIHVFGPSGSGTTTISKLLCERLGYTHFDSDSYFWLPTEDPFTVKRPREACLNLMKNDLSTTEPWVLSGSVTGWGEELTPFFDLVIFVYVRAELRLERLRKREYERYGDDILSGGDRYEASQAFLEWASSYEAGTMTGRSLIQHEKWLEGLNCSILRIENDLLDVSVDTILAAIE